MEKADYGWLQKFVVVAALVTVVFGTFYFVAAGKYDYLISLYAITAMLSLGLVILLRSPFHAVNISFFAMTAAIVLWSFSIMQYWGSALDREALFWAVYANISAAFIPAFFVQFIDCFPDEKLDNLPVRELLWFGPAVLLSLAVALKLVIKDVVGLSVIPGLLYPVYMGYILIYFAVGFTLLVKKYFNHAGMVRMQIRYIFLGSVLATVFPLIFNQLMPLLGDSRLTRLGPYFTIIFVGFAAYAITKHRLMDISVVISRSVAELLAILLHAVIYLVLVFAYRFYVSTRINLLFVLLTLLYGILVGQTHHRLRLSFQTTADKLFLRGGYDYYRALSDASSRVGSKLSLPDLLKVLYDTFYDVIEVAEPRIFLPEFFIEADRTSADYVVYDPATYQPQAGSQRVKIDSVLTEVLVQQREPLTDVKALKAALVIPCLLEDRLIAFFALGPKLAETAYTEEDKRLLKVLANQAAITLDHSRSYGKIKADLEATERQLERSQRLASLGTLTAGVTHEIRNPLTVIRAETERLGKQPRDPEYLKQYSELMLKHVDRIAGIVQRMLGLAKEKKHREIDVNLNEVIRLSLSCFFLNDVKVTTELGEIPALKGDPDELQEVFVNLIQNALDSMPSGGELKLRSYRDDGHLVAEVSDTGKGVPEGLREKIFDPFYSTRHEGVGLGLSIVYRIVREHGGDVKVESEGGHGATFKLIFNV